MLLVGLGSVVACGDDVDEGDVCKPSCPAEAAGGAGSGAGGQEGVEKGAAGSSSSPGGADSTDTGGASGSGALECEGAEDCSNGDPSDGEEVCGAGACLPGNAPPAVIAVTPGDQAEGVEPQDSILIEFSEALDPASVTASHIEVLDGDTAVAGELSYAGTQVTFAPKRPFALLTRYQVSVSTQVSDAEGVGLLQPFDSTFTVRDGTWSVSTAATGPIYELAPTLPITDEGDVLLSWIAKTVADDTFYCPPTARWFNHGAPLGAAKKLAGDNIQDCSAIRASGSRDGSALVSWQQDGLTTHAMQHRAGKWGAKLPLTTFNGTIFHSTVAVGSDGVMHYIEARGGDLGVFARHTDPTGAWIGASTGEPISSGAGEKMLSEPQIAVGRAGNAFAIWRARNVENYECIMVAAYSVAEGSWQRAKILPGSVANITGAGYERGAPAIAYDDDGNAVALWVRNSHSTARLMASHYRQDLGSWAEANAISGSLMVLPLTDSPALVFDGKTFVTAWTAQIGAQNHTYAARFDVFGDGWEDYSLVSDGTRGSAARMPRLASDAHQNLILAWPSVTSTDAIFDLTYQRYHAATGTWGGGPSGERREDERSRSG